MIRSFNDVLMGLVVAALAMVNVQCIGPHAILASCDDDDCDEKKHWYIDRGGVDVVDTYSDTYARDDARSDTPLGGKTKRSTQLVQLWQDGDGDAAECTSNVEEYEFYPGTLTRLGNPSQDAVRRYCVDENGDPVEGSWKG